MSVPSLALTFQDLIIRIAEFLGIADYSGGVGAAIPTDAADLEKCKRIVNDGYRRFINSNQRWQFLTPLITITFSPGVTGTATGSTANTLTDTARTEAAGYFIAGWSIAITGGTGSGQVNVVTIWNSGTKQFTFANNWVTNPDATSTYKLVPPQCSPFGDNSRYLMPDGFFGSLLMPFTYGTDGPKIRIEPIVEERIRELVAAGLTQGDPSLVAFRPLTVTHATGAPRWEAIFWPAPGNAYVVTSRARLYPDKLTNLTDYHLGGFQHDETVLKCALAEAERQVDDTIGVQEKAAAESLRRSLLVDQQAVPRRLGDYGDKSETRFGYWQRPSNYFQVDTYNGQPT